MKVLFIHATAGAGHQKAAEAIFHGLKDAPGYNAVCVDALDHTSPLFRRLYRETYAFLISKIPFVWKFVFGLLDVPLLQPAVRSFRRIYNSINMKKLEKYLIDEQFDCIVSTHFMPNEVVSALKKRGAIRSKLVTVVTDFDIHRIWLASGVDKYCVASGWTLEKAVGLGISREKVMVSGIPTDPKFLQNYNLKELKDKLGLYQNEFTVLIATGSFGIGPIEEVIQALSGFQMIAVCGHNKNLFERLNRKQYPMVKALGLVNNMHELMSAADCMVTKPGGLSIAEALVKHLPLVFFNPIPGQETNNIKVLATYGVGKNGFTISDIIKEVGRLKSSHETLLQEREKTKKLASPSAVQEILKVIS